MGSWEICCRPKTEGRLGLGHLVMQKSITEWINGYGIFV